MISVNAYEIAIQHLSLDEVLKLAVAHECARGLDEGPETERDISVAPTMPSAKGYVSSMPLSKDQIRTGP